ncbi:hypothetical protein [uncultured Roseobacter sp.]|nr:hypothetical protein [uncultured Roseobacter sp.]
MKENDVSTQQAYDKAQQAAQQGRPAPTSQNFDERVAIANGTNAGSKK